MTPDAAAIDAIDAPDADRLAQWIGHETAQPHRTPQANERLWAIKRAAYRLADPADRRRIARRAESAWRNP